MSNQQPNLEEQFNQPPQSMVRDVQDGFFRKMPAGKKIRLTSEFSKSLLKINQLNPVRSKMPRIPVDASVHRTSNGVNKNGIYRVAYKNSGNFGKTRH